MDDRLRQLHLTAGRVCGEIHTCGKKVRYNTEETAIKSAEAMNKKVAPKVLEPYPCPFCEKWHIGRKMDEAELQEICKRA